MSGSMNDATGAPIISRVRVDVRADLPGIIRLAGGDPRFAVLEGDILTVRGVTQDAMQAAVDNFTDPAFSDRQAKRLAAATELQRRIDEGMPWQGRVLQIDDASQNRMTSAAALAKAGTLPPNFAWIMKDNMPLPVTPDGMVQMASAAGNYVYRLRGFFWGLRTRIASAPAIEDVQAIDVAAGWPAPPDSPAPAP